MEIYRNLLEIINPLYLSELEQHYKKEDSLHGRIIAELLKNPELTSEHLLKKYEVSEGTLNKTLTIVKEILWDFNAQYIQTTFDDVFVLRNLLLQGKPKNALKFFNALQKKFENTQQWDKLDCLYIEGLRYAQITGNVAMAHELAKSRMENSKRLHAYTMLYSELIPEMIKLEGYKLKKFTPAYALYVDSLYQKAIRSSHHLLIHNALHVQYLLYSRFKGKPEKVFEIMNAIKQNAEINKQAMAPITYAIAMNAFVNFLTIYRNFGSPEETGKSLRKSIIHGGNMARVNLCYSMLEFALFEQKTLLVESWLKELEKVDDGSKFAQYRYAVIAIKAFIEQNITEFLANFKLFYSDPSHLNFPDVQITLRILEIIVLLKKKKGDLVVSKLEALRIFMGRNVDKERYRDERKILLVLTKLNENRKDFMTEIGSLEKSSYRNIYFIVQVIKGELL